MDTFVTAADLATAYRHGAADPRRVVEDHLARIDELQPALNAFVLVDAEGARRAAADAAERWAAGAPRSPLDGVPVTIKDIVAMRGFPVRSGSAVTPTDVCADDAPSVARLREAGAVILGKTTTPEFGWKGMTDSPLTGVTRNPWHLDHTPGGSSGGAAAALAAGIGTVAHANDGGGSVRIPASYCGLIGVKPTFGRVPHHPMDSPFSLTIATGPIARTVVDAALFLDEITRPDARDPWAGPYDPRSWRIGLDDGVRHLRIAATTTFGGAAVVDAEIEDAWRATVAALRDLGARVDEVDTVIAPLRPRFEAHWKAGFAHILRTIPRDRWDACDPGFVTLAREGMDVSLSAFGDAMAARAALIAELAAFHETYDLLLTPTMPTLAPRVDTVYHSAAFDRWEHAVPFTVPFNLTGQPAATVPVAVAASGLPVGMQLVAARWREDLVLRAARAVETAMAFPQPHPRLAAALAARAA